MQKKTDDLALTPGVLQSKTLLYLGLDSTVKPESWRSDEAADPVLCVTTSLFDKLLTRTKNDRTLYFRSVKKDKNTCNVYLLTYWKVLENEFEEVVLVFGHFHCVVTSVCPEKFRRV